MSSILTNNSAMVALQTLKSINMNLGKVQSEISTGKTVESAKDNAAVWAISKVMSSDVKGFEAISNSLSLGSATVGVALNGAEAITDLLTEVKGKIVNSQESNVDRSKIQTDIVALTKQITSIVGAAQFNGLNLLNKDGSVAILSSLDRDSAGSVTANDITIGTVNLGTNDVSLDAAGTYTAAGASAVATITSNATTAVAFTGTVTEGVAYTLNITGVGTAADPAASWDEITSAGQTSMANTAYVASATDTAATISAKLAENFNSWKAAEVAAGNMSQADSDAVAVTATATGLSIATTGFATGFSVVASIGTNVATTAGFEQKNAGALNALTDIDVSTSEGANAALDLIEGLIQTSINTAAALGSGSKQIQTQSDFVGKLTDLLTSEIGTLVDADMEAASAKLQALQTQQQLGVQALSIANQAPQTILSLFR